MPFNIVNSVKNRADKGLHFFLDDYRFVRLWNRPDDYISQLKEFACVLSPDFSMFTNFPLPVQIYNHYRKHWLAAYWQEHDIKVVPTICWSDESSYDWCFDGEPMYSTVAVSAQGTQRNRDEKEMFLRGYEAMMNTLHPTTILFYGEVPDGCTGNIVKLEQFVKKLYKLDGRC